MTLIRQNPKREAKFKKLSMHSWLRKREWKRDQVLHLYSVLRNPTDAIKRAATR
jgi:hypothetical protein